MMRAVEEYNLATRDKLGVVLCLPARLKKALAKATKKAQLKQDSAVNVSPFFVVDGARKDCIGGPNQVR